VATRVEWHGAEFLKAMDSAVNAGLDASADLLSKAISKKISRAGIGGGPNAKTAANVTRQIREAKSMIRSLGGIKGIQGKNKGKWTAYAKGKSSSANRAVNIEQRSFGLDVDPPGGSPRNRTGNLMRSIGWQKGTSPYSRLVGSRGVPYAGIQEFGGTVMNPGGQPFLMIGGRFVPLKKGTTNKSARLTKPHPIVIPPRPYIRPALAENRNQIQDTFSRVALGRLREAGWVK
jgi:phage gpG-like protein